MKLHGTLTSPFVRMCMVTAIETCLTARVQLLAAPVRPDEVNEALSKLSPIGKIPVLETDHGHALYDSRVIMEYFTHVAGNKQLLPDDGVKRFRILTLLALAQGLGDAAITLRYEQMTRPAAMRWPEFAKRCQARIAACINELENNWLSDLGDVTLGSIAVATAVGYLDLRELAPDWRNGHLGLSQFVEKFGKRESMTNTTPRP